MIVKIWNDKEWIEGHLIPELYQVMFRNRIYNLDADGFVRLGSVGFRLFEQSYQGQAYGYKV